MASAQGKRVRNKDGRQAHPQVRGDSPAKPQTPVVEPPRKNFVSLFLAVACVLAWLFFLYVMAATG